MASTEAVLALVEELRQAAVAHDVNGTAMEVEAAKTAYRQEQATLDTSVALFSSELAVLLSRLEDEYYGSKYR